MAKKKKKTTSARKPRAAPRGMYLTVDVAADGAKDQRLRITSFADITRIGHDVARAVRAYLRSVPLLPHVRGWSVHVYSQWIPTAAAPARKSDADPAQRASDAEELLED